MVNRDGWYDVMVFATFNYYVVPIDACISYSVVLKGTFVRANLMSVDIKVLQ